MPARARKIAVTAGDPAGVGPEVALRAIAELSDPSIVPILIGRGAVLRPRDAARFAALTPVRLESGVALAPGKRYHEELPGHWPLPAPGRGSVDTGRESLAAVDRAVDLWRAGLVDAVVTGPVSKALIEAGGVPFTGHTEYIAERIGEADPLMMMFSEAYRVLLASIHVPIAAVPGVVTEATLERVIRRGCADIAAIDGRARPVAVAGLDPHCGDEGAIGTFDRDVTRPLVERLRAEGLPVEGPFAADTLFLAERWKRYGLAVAMYHDQGLVPFKVLAFEHGVNVTLGLSIVRTSVDHGTAFDIAGTGRADHRSMIAAIELAARLADGRAGARAR